jgi:hypothetical protein
MRRSAGVTACAIVALLGSAVFLLFGVLGLIGMASAPSPETQTHYMKYFMWFFMALWFGAAAWGIASAVGLLQLKEWARISILIFSGLLLLTSIPGLVVIPFTPIQQPHDLPNNFTVVVRVILMVLTGALAGIGVWWVVFFNRKAVRAQFQGALSESAQFAGTPARPISITIIGWYLVISGLVCLPFLFFHMPVFLMGFMVKGWVSSFFMLGCGILQVVIGAGLLKLKPWSWSLAVGYFAFFAINAVIMVVLPGSQARYEQAMKSVEGMFGTPPSNIQFPIWFGLAICLPLFAVVLWFLIAQKKSFLPATQTSAPLG